MKNIILYLITGTRGGETRGRIINLLKSTPLNAHRISSVLGMDYKTVKHHLKVLEKHGFLEIINKGNYGAMFFLSKELEMNFSFFKEIWNKLGKDLGKSY
ncbi:winged helix-turn-helix transcriptional regulator [archaeon]|nr:winged helix-turn-helix transcriptional regulator [archaeon]PJC45311.1 MAG: ArsR family transcriptional regulator [Candidatus Pacearchaeota archaeon CG_4_9_14_0_2_um_filter_30_8]